MLKVLVELYRQNSLSRAASNRSSSAALLRGTAELKPPRPSCRKARSSSLASESADFGTYDFLPNTDGFIAPTGESGCSEG